MEDIPEGDLLPNMMKVLKVYSLYCHHHIEKGRGEEMEKGRKREEGEEERGGEEGGSYAVLSQYKIIVHCQNVAITAMPEH